MLSRLASLKSPPMTDFETIDLAIADGAATVTLNRPDKLNAWNLQLGLDLRKAVEDIAADESVRAVLITGAGRAFSSGADLSEPREEGSDGLPDLRARLKERYHPIITGIREMPKPVISAVNGPGGRHRLLARALGRPRARRRVVLLPARVREHRPRPRWRLDRLRARRGSGSRARRR